MKGWIYIIQFGNRDLVKVGMSEGDSPLPRIKSLDSTSVSEPIEKQETYKVDNPREVERFLHKKLIENKVASTSYNFSSSDNHSVDYVYRKICELIKSEYIEPEFKITSEKEIPSQYLDSSLIENDLNVVAKVNLDEGLEKTINWYKDYLKL